MSSKFMGAWYMCQIHGYLVNLVYSWVLSISGKFMGTKYSRLSLTQLCITQYYHLSRPDGLVLVFSPIYYCNSTTFISCVVYV